jgi:hypothetical protein
VNESLPLGGGVFKGRYSPLWKGGVGGAIAFSERQRMGRRPIKVVGIDLAGREKGITGMCFLEGNQARVSLVHINDKILEAIGKTFER